MIDLAVVKDELIAVLAENVELRAQLQRLMHDDVPPSEWRVRYEASEKRTEYFMTDAYDHFVAAETLKSRLAGFIAAGRCDLEM